MRSIKQVRREAKQMFRLCLVDGLLDQVRVRQAVQLERARHTASVESAMALPASLQASILSKLNRAYGPALNTSFVLDPSLVGGLRIRVASDVYDGSVRAGLESLQRSF